MSDHSRKISTVLAAVSSFISYHDKEDYEGVIIVVRQRNGLYDAFTGGSADDPDYSQDWGAAQFIVEAIFEDMAAMAEDNTPQLQVIGGGDTPMPVESAIPRLSDYPEIMQKVYHKSLHPGTRLNDKGELVDDPGVCHPRLNDQGKWVSIYHPTTPQPMSAFADPCSAAVMLPNGQAPAILNGIDFQAWQSAPTTLAGWVHVDGQLVMDEPVLVPKQGKKLAAGVVIMEPDGRFWLVAPTNAFGGYKTTFPKGRLEPGMNPQATAIKEAFEEAGLQVEITGLIGDFERTMTITRYYTARRLGGLPTQMDWESQAVLLIPKQQLLKVLNHANDHAVIQMMNKLNLGVNRNNDKILIASIGGEGGGATIYGRQTDNTWAFWREGSSMDDDDIDIWIPYRSEPVPELDEALPPWWMNAYPTEINPSFIPWFRERYEQHCKNASVFPENSYCSNRDRERWLEILYKNQKIQRQEL
jgi:8-oxo-dGTP pyrophosphatase MutT (NUDIX family)